MEKEKIVSKTVTTAQNSNNITPEHIESGRS